MSDEPLPLHSAEIIPFPRSAPAIAAQAEEALPTASADDLPEDPAARLRRALAILAAARAEQRDAVHRFQGVVGELHRSMTDLGRSLRTAQQRLDTKPTP